MERGKGRERRKKKNNDQNQVIICVNTYNCNNGVNRDHLERENENESGNMECDRSRED